MKKIVAILSVCVVLYTLASAGAAAAGLVIPSANTDAIKRTPIFEDCTRLTME